MASEQIVVAPRKPRLWFLDDVLDGDGPLWSRLRRAFLRTRPGVFADVGSDLGVYFRGFFLRKGLMRLALAVVGTGVGLLVLGAGWRVIAFAALLIIALVGRIL